MSTETLDRATPVGQLTAENRVADGEAESLLTRLRGRRRRRRSRVPAQRSDLNASRSSDEKSSGSSHAAKWPPLSTSLK